MLLTQGLPVSDFTTRSSSELSEASKRLITWSGFCHAVLFSVVTWSKSICFYGLVCFTVGWFTYLFPHCSKIRPRVWWSPFDKRASFKTAGKLLWVNESKTDGLSVLFASSVVRYVWSHHMTAFHSWHSEAPRAATSGCVLTVVLFLAHFQGFFFFFFSFLFFGPIPKHKHPGSCVALWSWSESMSYSDVLTPCFFFFLFFPHDPFTSTKVRGHRAGSPLSSWHLEVRAARRSGAWGSVSSTCRNTTFSSCWRTALSSCALLGQTGPWPSSGSTSSGWRRFVCLYVCLVLVVMVNFSVSFFTGKVFWHNFCCLPNNHVPL